MGFNRPEVDFGSQHGLWSLWDMLQPYAYHALALGRTTGTVLSVAHMTVAGSMSANIFNKLSEELEEYPRVGPLDELLHSSLRPQFERVTRIITKPGCTVSEIQQAATELSNRMHDALVEQQFLHVSPELAKLYTKQQLFGSEVEAKFPQMSEDIAEAGKCLALQRGTATVFHLMRVMEIAVRQFGDKLGITLVSDKNWHNILDEINKAVKALDQKAPQTKAFAQASAHLYNVKLCWRNEVMHPKQTYTAAEATALFGAVDTFIRDLAELL